MAFKDIEIIDFDDGGIELIAGTDNRVEVPYILSDTPPKGWKSHFESRWPDPQHLKISGNEIKVVCRMDETAIRKNGDCWNLVAKWVEEANRHYRAFDNEQQQQRAREEEIQQQEEKKRSDFEEWKHNLRRRH